MDGTVPIDWPSFRCHAAGKEQEAWACMLCKDVRLVHVPSLMCTDWSGTQLSRAAGIHYWLGGLLYLCIEIMGRGLRMVRVLHVQACMWVMRSVMFSNALLLVL